MRVDHKCLSIILEEMQFIYQTLVIADCTEDRKHEAFYFEL